MILQEHFGLSLVNKIFPRHWVYSEKDRTAVFFILGYLLYFK